MFQFKKVRITLVRTSFLQKNYPKATSNTIIKAKPKASPIVPISVCLPYCDDGISSSVTTYIIAPAAKASKYGKTGTAKLANIIVINPATGSTNPDKIPYKQAFLRELPAFLIGIEIIAPSGMF